uniref:Uncharacterized protein n=1 Tax=Gouania willdenowi TaxID=441366 RepID=A0A8C5DXF3_GOUWI
MEVNLDEASQLNSSTVTISFEEFVRSQSREEDSQEDVKENQGKGYKTAVTTELEDVDAEALESPKAGDNISSGEPSDQVSPRTVTIQAEVHAISPKQEAASSMEKLAPIFNRKKTANSPTKVTSSPQAEIGQLSPSVKHKSNVVLLEEDLELVVIESESPLKCSDIEKKQFMAAFKQPNMDHVSKGKAVKSQTKQKPEEENVDAADESVKEPCAVKVSQSSTENKQPTKKPTRKRKNRIKATKKEKGTISPPAEDMDTKVIEDDNKNKGSPSSTPTLRRSRRERPIHAPEASPSPPVRTTRRQNDSKPVSDVTQDSPGTTSTPKTRKSKRGLFVAQMMCAPDAKGSPISSVFFFFLFFVSSEDNLLAEIKDKPLPLCESGCIKSKLGLLNIESERDMWELLKVNLSLLEEKCWDLLSNSRRRGVDLLYCNMEHLLPLPLTPLTVSSCKPEQITSVSEDFPPVSLKEILQPESLQSKTRLLKTAEAADCSDSSSPIKVSDRMRNKKRRHRKPKQEGLHSDSDSDDGFVSLCKPRAAPQKLRKTLTSEERARIIPVSQSLESIADFYDSLSYVDSSLCLHHDQSETNRDVSSISVIIKDGMTDDSRIETDKGSRATRDSLLQIQGAVEALSFHRCRAAVGDAWDSSQQLPEEPRKEVSAELSLPVAAHREGYTFNQDGLCQPQLVLQRRALLESLVGRGVFGNLTTRSAAALDYLPVIRTICRLEQLKEQCKVKRRFLHYLDVIHWGLDKSTLQLLAKDFPQSSDEGPK